MSGLRDTELTEGSSPRGPGREVLGGSEGPRFPPPSAARLPRQQHLRLITVSYSSSQDVVRSPHWWLRWAASARHSKVHRVADVLPTAGAAARSKALTPNGSHKAKSI